MSTDETTPPPTDECVLIDLSSIAHPIWHMSQADPDPNKTSQQVVARVRALAGARRHVGICCDAGRSFRKDIAATYKANRPESDAALQHQITLACEQLQADGFPVWSVKGFEADDLIASATAQVLAMPNMRVLIVSADKDLLQLVEPRVRQMRPDTGAIADEAVVAERFGVKPSQIRDYLALCGDTSDNIKGAQGVGPKTAATLLQKYGSLDGIYVEWRAHPTAFKPGLATALREFESRMADTCALVTLKTDVPVPIEDMAAERVPKEVATFGEFTEEIADDISGEASAAVVVDPTSQHAVTNPERAVPHAPADAAPSVPNGGDSGRALARAVDVLPAAPVRYELSLDPVRLPDAIRIAKDMYESRLFSQYGTPQAVLSTIMLGRELGMPAMASLRQVHIVEGRHSLSADLMVALILKSGLAEYFEPDVFDDQHAIWVTKRIGGRKEFRLEHTIQMAQAAGKVKKDSNWVTVPIDMLNARAKSRLARLVYPDVVGGLYTPDELRELRDSNEAAA